MLCGLHSFRVSLRSALSKYSIGSEKVPKKAGTAGA